MYIRIINILIAYLLKNLIAFLPGVGQGRVFRVPRWSCHCCLWMLYRRKGVLSDDGSNVQRRTVGSAGRSANSWVVGHRSTWSQVPTGVSLSDCVRLLKCSPNRGLSRICRAQSYVLEDEAPDADYQFRAVILFLSQCGSCLTSINVAV